MSITRRDEVLPWLKGMPVAGITPSTGAVSVQVPPFQLNCRPQHAACLVACSHLTLYRTLTQINPDEDGDLFRIRDSLLFTALDAKTMGILLQGGERESPFTARRLAGFAACISVLVVIGVVSGLVIHARQGKPPSTTE